ncbi:zinc knuckle CX2CX4HX4C containing protein [Tanacetum coccineum]
MVAYLEKTDGNTYFHEIIDFLTQSSIHYTLTLKNVPVPLVHFPINALTSKVFSFMVKKGKHFSGNVTPLFESMLVQPTEDEGEASERQSKPQPTPSPPHPSADKYETQPDPSPRPSPIIPDSIPEGSGGNHGGQSSSDRSLLGNKDGLTLQSVYDLCVSLCKQVTHQAKEIKHLKAQIKKLKKKAKPVITHHKAWMKSGRKHAKAEPIVHKDPAFNDLDDIMDDAMDYMESEDAQDEGRTSFMVLEEKESTQKGVSTEVEVSTVKPDEGTDKSKVSTDKPEVSTAKPKDGTSDESTAPTTVFRDDETIAEFLVSMSQNKAKQKGVEIKDAEDSDRPSATSTRSILTLKPLPKIDPKDKGKKVLEEEAESKGVDEAERKFDQLAKDEEIARKVQGFKRKKEKHLQLKRAKFLYDIIAAQRRFLAQQRAIAIRSKPPTRTQLRNQMMTYLKHIGRKKHADLKNKNFEEIQVLYKKIEEMNEESKDPKKKRVVNETPREEDTTKVPIEQEVTEQGTKKRKSGHIVEKFMETKSFVSKLHKVSSLDGDYLVVYRVNGHFRAFNYLMEVLHIFDRQDLFHLYDLVMKQYSKITPEGIELILWGDLKIMMESSTKENDQGLEVEEESTAALHLNYTIDPSLLFSVASFRSHVESSCLSPSLDPIRWNKHLPIKVNIHAWRLCLGRLPTRVNLDKKGIDLDSVRCPWDVGDYPRDIQGLSSWADLVNLNNFSKGYFDVVIPTTFWVLWRFRNSVCFDAKPPRKDTIGVNMRTKRNTKILQKFEDSIHSINNSKTNKKNTSKKSTDYQKNTKEFENDTRTEKVCNGSGEAHMDACMVTNKVREKEDGLIKNGMKENVGLFGTQNSKVNANPEKSECTFVNKCDNDENAMLNEKIECVTNSGKKENMFNGENGVTSKSNSMTYAHIVKQDELSKNLNYIPTMITRTGSEVVIFDEVYNIRRMWGKFRITDIDANKNGHYVFKFRDSNSLNVVLDKGPWMVKNKPLFVQKWNSKIGMEKMEPKRLLVWVKIVNVPLEAWSVDGISALASSLGKPMLMDTMTTTMCHKGVGNFEYARVLMEMDAEKEFKKEIVIQYRDRLGIVSFWVFGWSVTRRD